MESTKPLASVEIQDFSKLDLVWKPYFDVVSLEKGVFCEEDGWTFTILWHEIGNTYTYRTTPRYEGLYIWEDEGWRQTKGNGQFSLPKEPQKALDSICKQFSKGCTTRRSL